LAGGLAGHALFAPVGYGVAAAPWQAVQRAAWAVVKKEGRDEGEVQMTVTRSAESWQFFAFVFGALLATVFGFIDELQSGGWRIGLKVVALFLVAYFALLSPRGRNFLVGLLNRFKTLERR
jgi:hypothetical protein